MSATHTDIVSPAGNSEKLRFAVRYGADAVYFGGDAFNLRVQADNISEDSIEDSISFCKEHGTETVFLMNAFLHEHDLPKAKEYIKSIVHHNFDAVMVSDPGMLLMLQDAGFKGSFHLSTQMNTLNHRAIDFWQKAGFSRVVLGREVSLEEIQGIKKNSDMEIEVFAHGALCIAYSGRCLLSRYLSGRDANQGDCSQPCRWRFSLIEEKRQGNHLDIIEYASGTEILSSKDLCLISRLDKYIDAGVNAFKIEGRMKSLYHAANTTRLYRHAVETAGTEEFSKLIPFWLKELDLINHRPYTDDLFNEFDNLVFDGVPYIKKALFLGYKINDGNDNTRIRVKTFNPIRTGDELDTIFPIVDNIVRDTKVTVQEIHDIHGNRSDIARPGDIWELTLNSPVSDDAIFRKLTTSAKEDIND